MIVLSDCFTEKVDEGCLNVANSLVKYMKKYFPDIKIISYGKRTVDTEEYTKLNKLFLNTKLLSCIKKNQQQILYIPFASNTFASILRILVLSFFSKQVWVIFSLRHPMNKISCSLLRISKANIFALSKESYNFYHSVIGEKALYLQAGVDLKKFYPASLEKIKILRKKYKVFDGKKVLLHVGHLKKGRNIEKLMLVNPDYHVFFVVSSETVTEKDNELRGKLLACSNITLVEEYVEHIEEFYQMADVYFFPVTEIENCIDVPLSVLEAAACNVPVVTTAYGELKQFKNTNGIYFINELDANSINRALNKMTEISYCNNRAVVEMYDWEKAAKEIYFLLNKTGKK